MCHERIRKFHADRPEWHLLTLLGWSKVIDQHKQNYRLDCGSEKKATTDDWSSQLTGFQLFPLIV
jgi:hypothetical protein